MKQLKSLIIAVAAITLLASVVTVLAKRGHRGPRPECVDPISQEKQTRLLEKFGEKGIDADKNGTLTCEEVKAFMQKNHPKDSRHGSRHHGSHKECTDPIPADKQAKLLEHFGEKGIDADKDGTLTCEEVKAFMQKNHPKDSRHGSRHHGSHKECTDPIPADKQAMLLEKFGSKGIDADKNGTLTCEEVKTFFKEHHSKGGYPHHGKQWDCTDPISADKQTKLLEKFGSKGIDADKNGTLTCEEIKAFFKEHYSKGGHPHHGKQWDCTDPIPDDKQAKLLEHLGEKGIDANSDGKLTCEELKAFFAKNHKHGGKDGKCGSGKSSHHWKKGKHHSKKEQSSCSGKKTGK